MQFRDLQRQYNLLKPRMDQALVEVAASGRYIMGDKVVELERKLADYVGVEHCISCASGTDALYLALRVMGVGAGDAVFVPDFTFFASAEVVSLCRFCVRISRRVRRFTVCQEEYWLLMTTR